MIKYFLLLFAALFFISCSDDDTTETPIVIDSPIVGTWTRTLTYDVGGNIMTNNYEVKFESDGDINYFYTLNNVPVKVQSYNGKFSLNGDNITLTGGSCNKEGKYSFSISGNSLTIAISDDECIESGRLGVIGTWSKK